MIKFIHNRTGVPYEQMYLVGHSAGSHISGLAGKFLKPHKLGAIIALDPAGLSQLGLPENHRLAPHDALYVETIHTDITLLGNPSTKLGQAVFFPNWGLGQPQCPNATAAEFDFVCDHFSALYYFAESVRQPKMYGAIKCPNAQSLKNHSCSCGSQQECKAVTFMGGEPIKPKSGIYYLSTVERAPYGLGAKVRMRHAIKPTYNESSVPSQRIALSLYNRSRRKASTPFRQVL